MQLVPRCHRHRQCVPSATLDLREEWELRVPLPSSVGICIYVVRKSLIHIFLSSFWLSFRVVDWFVYFS